MMVSRNLPQKLSPVHFEKSHWHQKANASGTAAREIDIHNKCNSIIATNSSMVRSLGGKKMRLGMACVKNIYRGCENYLRPWWPSGNAHPLTYSVSYILVNSDATMHSYSTPEFESISLTFLTRRTD